MSIHPSPHFQNYPIYFFTLHTVAELTLNLPEISLTDLPHLRRDMISFVLSFSKNEALDSCVPFLRPNLPPRIRYTSRPAAVLSKIFVLSMSYMELITEVMRFHMGFFLPSIIDFKFPRFLTTTVMPKSSKNFRVFNESIVLRPKRESSSTQSSVWIIRSPLCHLFREYDASYSGYAVPLLSVY